MESTSRQKSRQSRAEELRRLQSLDPGQLILLYCEATGLLPTSQLPSGISFARMIEEILDRDDAAANLATRRPPMSP
jgi:hypothetical protein